MHRLSKPIKSANFLVGLQKHVISVDPNLVDVSAGQWLSAPQSCLLCREMVNMPVSWQRVGNFRSPHTLRDNGGQQVKRGLWFISFASRNRILVLLLLYCCGNFGKAFMMAGGWKKRRSQFWLVTFLCCFKIYIYIYKMQNLTNLNVGGR